MTETQGIFHNHHRVAAAAICIIMGSKSFVSHLYMASMSCWGDLIFSSTSSRWNLNGPHHAEALSDMLGCFQAFPAGQKKTWVVICMQKLEYVKEVCESVTVLEAS